MVIDAEVPAPDGTPLHTEIHLPDGDGPWPAMLLRTPYGTPDQRLLAPDQARRGTAAVVVQDCRGRFGSGGEFDLGARDDVDGAAAIAWVREQPWCDGNVALYGFSYGAFTQLRAMVGGAVPICAAPIMGPGWWRGLDFRQHGAFHLALAAHWLTHQAANDPATPEHLREEIAGRALEFQQILGPPDGGPHEVDIDAALAHPALGRLPLIEPREVEGNPVFEAIWNSLWTEACAADKGPSPDDAVASPCLVGSGWYDLWARDHFVVFDHLRKTSPPAVAAQHRLFVSPAGHGFDPLREVDPGSEAWRFFLDVDQRWCREWLLDHRRDLRDLDPITWFLMGANTWEGSATWPPAGAELVRFFLDDGALSDAARRRESSIGFTYDPRHPVPTRGGAGLGLPPGPSDQRGLTGFAREDIYSFDGEATGSAFDICGPVVAYITFSSDAPDTDITAKLLDVAPNGVALSVVDGIVRARWRNGPEPSFLEPGTPVSVRVDLGPIAWRVAAGHRLRLDVSSSSFPRFDRNPNTGNPEGTDGITDLRVARQRIHLGGESPSTLELWIRH